MNYQRCNMPRPAFCFFVLLFFVSCSSPELKQSADISSDSLTDAAITSDQQERAVPSVSGTVAEPIAGKGDFTIEVFENKDGTGGFGYDLLNGGKVSIHQPHIPAVSGTSGFATKAEAEKTANLMLLKIQKGIMPPTITVEELDSLGIKH